VIIEEGLIAIGIFALIAAIFLLRGKGKTSQPKQRVMHKPAVNKQVVDLAGPSVSLKAQTAPFPVPQVPFPVSAGNRQTVGFAEQNTQSTQISFPVSQVPFPGLGNGQIADFVEPTIPASTPFSMPTAGEQAITLSSILSGVVPSSPSNAVSKVLPDYPSIDRQLAELMADTWALQQQAIEIGRRLNYLSTCIQHSLTSTPDEPDAKSKGDN